MSVFHVLKLAVVLPTLLLSSMAAAQSYEELEVNANIQDDKTTQRRVKSTVNSVLGGDTPLEGVQTQFDGWFVQFIIPQMTKVSNVDQYTEMREDFIANYLRRTKSAKALEQLNKVALEQFEKVAKGNFHPAARYNAMLIIGELNTRDEVKFGTKSPAVPSIKALEVMVTEFTNPHQVDIVRVAALVGIVRHMQIDAEQPKLPETARNYVISRLEPLAASKSPPLEPGNFWPNPSQRSKAGHFWMKRLAMEILALAATAQPRAETVNLLIAALNDDTLPYSVRFDAAKLLGLVKVGSEVDAADVAKAMGGLLAQELSEETKRIEDEIAASEEQAAGVGGIPPRGEFGGLIQAGGGVGGEPWKVDRLCRHTLQRCNEIKVGLTGPRGRAGIGALVADQELVKDILKEVQSIADATKEPEIASMDTVLRRITVSTNSLKDLCKRKLPVPKDTPPVLAEPEDVLGL